HDFAVAERDGDLGECEVPVRGRDETLAPQLRQDIEHARVEHIRRTHLVLDHVETGQFDVHGSPSFDSKKVRQHRHGCRTAQWQLRRKARHRVVPEVTALSVTAAVRMTFADTAGDRARTATPQIGRTIRRLPGFPCQSSSPRPRSKQVPCHGGCRLPRAPAPRVAYSYTCQYSIGDIRTVIDLT